MTISEGTAVARRDPSAVALPPQANAAVEERKIRNALAQQLRGATWSKDLSADGVRALAEYCYRRGVDPVSEVEVLGGKPYLTATYFDRIGADLIAAGVVDRVEQLHVGHDPRLTQLVTMAEQLAAEGADDPELRAEATNARREQARRLALRIKHAAPEGAAAVVITRIYVRGIERPIEAANWAGGGIRPKTYSGKAGDPIGDAEPTKTAEKRSRRRAWMQLLTSDAMRGIAQQTPALARAMTHAEQARNDAAQLAATLTDDMARGSELRESMRPHAIASGDEYGVADERPEPAVRGMPQKPTAEQAAYYLDQPDPYAIEDTADERPGAPDDADDDLEDLASEQAAYVAEQAARTATDADRANAQRDLLPPGAAAERKRAQNAVAAGH